MMYLSVNDVPDKHGMYAVWFALDAKHETRIFVDANTTLWSIIGIINGVLEQYKKGLLK